MKRAIVLAYYFPPLAGIASARAAGLAQHLPGFGWEPIVVTTRHGHYHRAAGDEPDVAVHRTRAIELSRLFRRGYGYVGGGSQPDPDEPLRRLETGNAGGTLRRLVHDFAYVPDAQVGWIPFAVRAATKALAGAPVAVVYSSSVPYSAHFAAMRVATRHSVPWIAELRDPWITGRHPDAVSPRRRRLDGALERKILARADHLIVTTEGLRADLLAATPLRADRITVIRNGFDPSPDGDPPSAAEPLTIVYAGTVAAGEDMAPVLAALDRVEADSPGAFRLRVLGPTDAWIGDERPWLELAGTVSPAAARGAVADASALLLVQLHEAYRRIVPGKLFEYLGARRPILALVPPETEMEALLCQHSDARILRRPDELPAALEQLLAEHRAGSLQEPRVPRGATGGFERESQAGQLAEVFERLRSEKAG